MPEHVVAFLERITPLHRPEQVGSALAEALAWYGFDGLLYAYQRVLTSRALRLEGKTHVFAHHDPRFLADLFADGKFMRSLGFDWARLHFGAISWDDLAGWSATCTYHETREIWQRHGMQAGYLVSLHQRGQRSHGLMSLSSTRHGQKELDAIWRRAGRRIMAKCHIAHLRVATLPPPDDRSFGNGPPLSPRQREVLEWVAVGKNVADIATILGLRPATVEKHLRLARMALGADTTTQAVMTASLRDQIFNLPIDWQPTSTADEGDGAEPDAIR